MRKLSFISVLLILATAVVAIAQTPDYNRPVVDLAEKLSPAAVEQIEEEILSYRDQTGNEIGILIVHDLGGRSIEDYAYDVFNKWGIGQKGKDNGVLFIAAIKERRARIEVGYGLEDKLTDLECGRIVGKNSDMARNFRNGAYASGIKAVIRGIQKGIDGNYNPKRTKSKDGDSKIPFVIIMVIVINIILVLIRRSKYQTVVNKRRKDRKNKSIWDKSSSKDDSFWNNFFFGGGSGGGSGGSFGGGGGFSFGGGSSGGGGASGGW